MATKKQAKKPVENTSISANIEKEKQINAEIRRLTTILKDVDANKRLTSKGLIEEAAFMKATLKELKQEIDKSGPIDEMSQGEYSILREHPALKAYNTMVQRYTAAIKELSNLLPKSVAKEIVDGFDDFAGGRDD